MTHLDFRAPGLPLPLSELLSRALPACSEKRRAQLAERGAVQRAGRPSRWLSERVPAGERLSVECEEADLADFSDLDRADYQAAGPWEECRVLTPACPWRRGVLAAPPKAKPHLLDFERVEERGPIAELRLWNPPSSPALLLDILAGAGLAVLGDARRGGILVEGGLRVRAGVPSEGVPLDESPWWPSEPVFCSEMESGQRLPILSVSGATGRALAQGHPWILRDRQTGDPARFAPGSLVEVRTSEGARCGLARVEGSGRIAARMWSRSATRPRQAASPEARVAKALARRQSLLAPPSGVALTDAFRLVHGEADGLPGLAVDRLGPLLRVLVSGRASEGFLERVLDALVGALTDVLGPDPAVIQVTHLRERPAGRLECVQLARGQLAPPMLREDDRLCVRERGLAFLVDPGLASPERDTPGVGLYLDQRENRARLARHARRGGRWLNLFAHTGAFGVALLAAGAEELVSVDLSAAYLGWLEQNLALNQIDASRHRAVRADGRRFLARLEASDRFDGIVIDPPTAAAAGRHFWSVARDLESVLERAMRQLNPGGALFVSRNDRRGGSALEGVVHRAAARAGRELLELREMPPGLDFPGLSGFPEGDAFRAVLATLH
ncbi:MAG: class I SAM-dependent methyltransferase [Myxococcota bacterium]